MTDDQTIEFLTEHFERIRQTQGATAATVRSVVAAFREAMHERQSDDSRLAQVEHALLQLIGHVSPRDFSKISGEELIDLVPIETIRNARDIHWARSKQPGLPLPPSPNVPQAIAVETSSGGVKVVPIIHQHRRRGDSSVSIETGRDGKTRIKGNVEAKTLGGWLVALIVFAIFAWREIQHAYYDPHGQEQRQAQPTQPSLSVPQLSPPSMPSPTGVHP